jgi:hypothetical protein
MTSLENKKQLKIKELLLEVNSTDITRVKKGLNSLKIHGDNSVIRPLLTIIKNQDAEDEQINKEIWQFLNDLSDSSAAHEVIACLKDDAYSDLHSLLLHAMWNSKLNYGDFLSTIVAKAIKGDFMTALECLTIIENLEGPFEEGSVMESQLLLAESVKDKNKDSQKDQLMSEIATYVKSFDRQVQ